MLYYILRMNNFDYVKAVDLERETGLGKDLLRKWRARYGFPTPIKREDGGLAYPREQIRQLSLIKRLLDTGFRPVQVVGKSIVELTRLERAIADLAAECQPDPLIGGAIELLRGHQLDALDELLQRDFAQRGPASFAMEMAVPLMQAIGSAWARGELETYQEHACSAIVARILAASGNAHKPAPDAPRILFGTPPEELHVLGFLMIRAVLRERGAYCIDIGPQVSINEADMAARAYRADIVCFSFSAAYPERRVRPFLMELRARLPGSILIWAGGVGTSHIKRAPAGVRLFSDLDVPSAAMSELIASPPAGWRDNSLDRQI